MNKRNHSISVRMTDREASMVEAMAKKYGDISFSDVFRRCVQERFSKVFPAYVKKKDEIGAGIPDEELTQEQICEMLTGKVIKNDAGLACFEPNGLRGLVVPLSLMGQQGMKGDYRIKR